MLTVTCDTCQKKIETDDTDGDAIRVQIGDDAFIYLMIGDEEGDPTGDHICPACAVTALTMADGIDLSSVFDGESDDDDDSEAPAIGEFGDGDEDDDGAVIDADGADDDEVEGAEIE